MSTSTAMPGADAAWPEDLRLKALHDLEILDTRPEAEFDRFTALLKRIFDVPIALVSLVDRDRQWFKSADGIDTRETSRSSSFCAHAIMTPNRPLVILDAMKHPKFHDNPLVTGHPGIRFYAGAVVRAPNGAPLGSVCIIDTRPRGEFPDQSVRTLADIAALASSEFSLRQSRSDLAEKFTALEAAHSQLQEERTRHDWEMRQAAEAQRRTLPPPFRPLAGVDAYAMLAPSWHLSGDSYGYGRLNDDASFFWIADVVGHGVGAALLAVTLSRVITGEMVMAARTEPPDPADVMQRINSRLIHPGEEEFTYFTMVYGMVDARTGHVRLAVAGHPPPLLLTPDGKTEVISATGLPLGLFDEVEHDTIDLVLAPGARLLIHSDGVTECENSECLPFETDRLSAWMRETRFSDPADALTDLRDRLARWRDDREPIDDITAVIIERRKVADS